MALYQLLCGLMVMIILSSKGCHSQQPTCGRAPLNSRIVGGHNAPPGSWPWQALLEIRNSRNESFICGGSLITNMWVLTAAHCIPSGTTTVRVHLGQQDLIGPNPNEVSRSVSQTTCHPHYNDNNFNNDICLLKLSAPVNFTDYVYPVCLAAANSTYHSGVSSWVTGWGTIDNGTLPNVLQEVNVPIVGNNECRCTYSFLTENMLCAGLRSGGKDSCQGDSGGPLVTKRGVIWVQGGVVSFGFGCGLPLKPGVYARVSRYQDWISNVTGNSKPGFVTFTSSGYGSDSNFTCPTTPPYTRPPTTTWSPPTSPVTDRDDSVFGGGDNVVHFSHFSHLISLCALLLSLFVLVGDA